MPRIKISIAFTDEYEERFVKSLVDIAEKKFCEEHINDFRTEELEAENEKRVKA
jgi:hypothetical protein